MAVRLLTEETIGKIAAGEVVERAASVVKELLENALDAGAHRLLISLRGGGLELIEVGDDGHGIPAAELPLTVQRHATSKLATFEDLDRLRTLGFRGEALPSIGAVSSLAIRSRPADQADGRLLCLEFGRGIDPRPVGSPVGTVVTVRDLFANVPARRKFLRQPATETSYAVRAVSAYAAAYPGVAVDLAVDDRRIFASDGQGDPVATAAAVYGPEIAAAAVPLQPLESSAAVPGVAVDGWVGSPAVTRSHRQGIVLFVNGRWIQNRALAFALEEAYHSLLLVGRHPVAVVHVRVDPAAVDVNVHPTKAEVKFVDERAVCRAVQRATHAALAGTPQHDLPRIHFLPGNGTRAAQPPLPLARPTWTAPSSQLDPPPGDQPRSHPTVHPSGVPILRVLGQVGASFIVAEGPEGVYLIDQHAAHERVLYERLVTALRGLAVDRQPLLDPLPVDLGPEEQAAFDRSREELSAIGFEIEPFGPGSVVVRAMPAMLRGIDVAERLRLILRELADGGEGDSWLDAVAISTACHTSIRAGQNLSLAEMRELVADLERSSQPRACGHGRPTMLQLTRDELEKQFARR
jgi:DNA mismatch repair protein MutL